MGCQGVDHFVPYPTDGTQLAFAGFQDQAGILTEFVKQVTVGDGSEATDRVEQKEGVGDTEGVCVGRHTFSLSGKEGHWQRETARDHADGLSRATPPVRSCGRGAGVCAGRGLRFGGPVREKPP